MSMLIRPLAVLLLLAMSVLRPAIAAPTLTIAAASDLVHCLAELNAGFQRAHPDADLRVTTGASGNFHAQIRAGAPYDVFLSADVEYPRALAAAGLADAASLLPYATGRLALWTLRDDLDLSAGLAVLAAPGVERVAIANPDIAPYGRAAKAALEAAGVYPAVRPRLVFGENIAQTAQFVLGGSVDAGIVSLSVVRSPKAVGIGHYQAIAPALHPPLVQGAVITAHGRDNPLAAAYLDYLRSAEARAVFDRHGFLPPAPAGAAP